MINLLPIEQDERIQTVMPMPDDPEVWDSLNVVFATCRGNIP